MQCGHTDEIGTVDALLLCPKFALKVPCSSFPTCLWIPAFFSLSETAFSSPGSDWPEHREDWELQNKGAWSNVHHWRVRHYHSYSSLLTPQWNRVPGGFSPCCPGSNLLMNTCFLAVLPPCLTSLTSLHSDPCLRVCLGETHRTYKLTGEIQKSNSELWQNSYFFSQVRK